MFLFHLDTDHIRITAVTLQPVTDYTDDLVRPVTRVVYHGSMPALPGQIFLVEDPAKALSRAVISYAADFQTSTLSVENYDVLADFDGSDFEVLEAPTCQIQETLLTHLMRFAPGKLLAMANTWGDRNGWSRVNDGFIRSEVDACRQIGLDALQIDDGWQTGSTADLARRDSENRRLFDGDFWNENTERFPLGLKAAADYARENNVRLGLWFAPDFHGCFAHAERDIGLLKSYAENEKIDLFKLDMIYVLSKEDKAAFESYLSRLQAFSSLQLDVTNGQRLGYLGSMRHGTVFVENRYSAWKNYYPYRTFRNLWTLGRFIPTQTLLGEVLNAGLNQNVYDPGDVCAPCNYSEDYLLALSCVTSPLFWMETQFLSEERREELNRLLPIWKQIRDDLLKAPVIPVGQEPNGFNFSGYRCGSYAILFRDNAPENTFRFDLALEGTSSVRCLASNGDVSLTSDGLFTADHPRTYGLFKIC